MDDNGGLLPTMLKLGENDKVLNKYKGGAIKFLMNSVCIQNDLCMLKNLP